MIDLRPMTLEDIDRVSALEAADSTAPWDANALFTYFLRDDSVLIVSEEDGEIVGFAGLLLMPPECDILDITVDRRKRNRGHGTQLLTKLLQEAAKKGVKTAFLEVRAGNESARHLYEKLGFEETGIRKNYYTDPVEDGISMRWDME